MAETQRLEHTAESDGDGARGRGPPLDVHRATRINGGCNRGHRVDVGERLQPGAGARVPKDDVDAVACGDHVALRRDGDAADGAVAGEAVERVTRGGVPDDHRPEVEDGQAVISREAHEDPGDVHVADVGADQSAQPLPGDGVPDRRAPARGKGRDLGATHEKGDAGDPVGLVQHMQRLARRGVPNDRRVVEAARHHPVTPRGHAGDNDGGGVPVHQADYLPGACVPDSAPCSMAPS
mmetsp:Transcript_87700/g.244217  ORF Transcript_87700/g.244217 Transcript_87700/m.244217 type:complete len:237 (-) Transcript_87700:225-935(-)